MMTESGADSEPKQQKEKEGKAIEHFPAAAGHSTPARNNQVSLPRAVFSYSTVCLVPNGGARNFWVDNFSAIIYSGSYFKSCVHTPRDLEVPCITASLLQCFRPPQGGVRALIMHLGPKVFI